MADDLRYQRKCFYASPEHSTSFWGTCIYIYQGKGSLRLTTNSLCLEGCPQGLEVPIGAIKSIGLGRFSLWSKPFGLIHLIVRFTQEGEPRAIHLVPYESVWHPTWKTSKLVASWYETLGRAEALANRVDPPQFDPAALHSIGKGLAVAAFLFLILPLAVIVLIGWLVTYI